MIPRDCRASGAGIYIKRILVAEKERGTGQAALRAFIDRFGGEADRFWLIVRNDNSRARDVYRKLGFARFDATPSEARLYDSIAEAPAERCYRMMLTVSSPT
jgi:ribosomal protein S18 acetylase RimI-like enzyme